MPTSPKTPSDPTSTLDKQQETVTGRLETGRTGRTGKLGMAGIEQLLEETEETDTEKATVTEKLETWREPQRETTTAAATQHLTTTPTAATATSEELTLLRLDSPLLTHTH